MPRTLTACVEYDRELKLYVGMVPGMRGAHTQAATLDELQYNLKEVVELCLEDQKPSRSIIKALQSCQFDSIL
jgi:predicted RNase H-like HicB family nuclease